MEVIILGANTLYNVFCFFGVVFDSLDCEKSSYDYNRLSFGKNALFACCYSKIGDPGSIRSAQVGWGSERCHCG